MKTASLLDPVNSCNDNLICALQKLNFSIMRLSRQQLVNITEQR